MPPSTSSTWARTGLACPIATTTCRDDAKLKQIRAPVTASTSRRCSRWPATRMPRRDARTSSRSRPSWPRCSGPRSKTAIRSRPTTNSSSPSSSSWPPATTGRRISSDAGVEGQGRTTSIVSQPSYITAFSKILRAHAAADLEDLFSLARAERLRAVSEQGRSSTSTSRSTARRCAACHENEPRWKRGVASDQTARSARRSASSTSRKYFPPSPRRAWTSWSATCSPRTRPTSTRSTGWARRPSRRRRPSSPSSPRRSATRSMARLQRAADRQGRSRRQRHARQRVRVRAQPQQARHSRSIAPSGA